MKPHNYHRTPEHIEEWASEHREAVQALDMLEQENIRAGLYSGSTAALGVSFLSRAAASFPVALAHSGCFAWSKPRSLGYHITGDIDLMVHNDDFWRSTEILQAEVEHETRKVDTTDGYQLDYNLFVARKKVGSKVLEICHPDGPTTAQNGDFTTQYNWHVSDLAVKGFVKYKTRAGTLQVAKPEETEIIYGILQRSEADIIKGAFAASFNHAPHEPYIENYMDKRLTEMNIDWKRLIPYSSKVVCKIYDLWLQCGDANMFGSRKRFARRNDGQTIFVGPVKYTLRIDAKKGNVWLEQGGEIAYSPVNNVNTYCP